MPTETLKPPSSGHLPKPPVKRIYTRNCASGRNGRPVTTIVLHHTAGTIDSAIAWFRNPAARVSAHFVVPRDNERPIVQVVHTGDTAWHAGTREANQGSIGIEIEAHHAGHGMTDSQERKLVELIRYLMSVFDVHPFNVLPHSTLRATECPAWIWSSSTGFKAWIADHFFPPIRPVT